MCGRYTLTRQEDLVEDLEAALGESAQGEWWKPRFNVAPTQPAPVVLEREGTRTIELLRWGLVPFWARAGSIEAGPRPEDRPHPTARAPLVGARAGSIEAGPRPEDRPHPTARAPLAGAGGARAGAKPPLMINARIESVADKAVFRDALDRKRCLVPADGFFEWLKDGKARHPFYLHPSPRRTIAFAGLWARARTDAGELLSFTILTGPANDLVAPIHDRMPVVLDPGSYAAWLDPAVDGDAARKLLGVPPIADWIATPVSQHVNSAQHDDPSCIAPPDTPKQGSLFD